MYETTAEEKTSAASGIEPVLELEMQELETMESPGFWTSAAISAAVSTAGAISLT